MQTTQIVQKSQNRPILAAYSKIGGKSSPSKKKGKETAIRQLNKAKKDSARLNSGATLYTHNNTFLNPEYELGRKSLSFESCLVHDKSHFFRYENGQKLIIKTLPKWLTNLQAWKRDQESGEDNMVGLLQTDEFKASNYRKIKALDKFCNYYQPKYQEKEVTMLFLTFTRANYAKKDWKSMVNHIKETFKRIEIPVLGFVWTSEVSLDYGIHWHYHMCIAIDRVNWKKIPKQLKFESVWGQRTQIDFVKKNIKHYMAKYFAKHNARVEGFRSYGKSSKYI